MKRSSPYKWWNLLFFIGVLTINTLSVTLPLGGNSTGEISDRYYTHITPAGYAFSIWSLIYLLLAGFIVYQLLRAGASKPSVQSLGIWFILSCTFNMAWILLWQYLYIELSLIAMVLLLITLIVIYTRTRIKHPSTGERWLLKLPFSLYLGWISVATIVNVAVVLTKNDWGGFGMSGLTWAVIMLITGTLLALAVSLPYRDPVYPLVFVWAYIAIAAEHRAHGDILAVAMIAATALLIYSLRLALIPRRSR